MDNVNASDQNQEYKIPGNNYHDSDEASESEEWIIVRFQDIQQPLLPLFDHLS